MDEVIFEEFKGTGNMELRLDRRLAERRIYPAIDVEASSTRHEELLFDRNQLQQVWKLRRVLNALEEGKGLELLIDKIRTTKSNDEFLAEIAKAPAPAGDGHGDPAGRSRSARAESNRCPLALCRLLPSTLVDWTAMKTDIHPNYVECPVHCSCGNEFTTRSTVPELRVELCSECHPFYTGKQKLVDTGGRVERFQRRYAKSDAAKTSKNA